MVGELKQEVAGRTGNCRCVSSMQPIQRESLLSLLSLIVISMDFATFKTLYGEVAVSIFVGKNFKEGSQALSYLDLRTLSNKGIKSLCSHNSLRPKISARLQSTMHCNSDSNQCKSSFSSLDLQLHKMSPQAQEPAALP